MLKLPILTVWKSLYSNFMCKDGTCELVHINKILCVREGDVLYTGTYNKVHFVEKCSGMDTFSPKILILKKI